MNTHHGQDTLISYLKKHSNKSYRRFLYINYDVIIASVTSNLKWNNLDNAWAGNYIREAEKIFVDHQQVVETLKEKLNIERLKYKKELQAYWQGVIKEYEKENLVSEKKSYSKKINKILTKDLPETSKKNNKRNNDGTDNLFTDYMSKKNENPETFQLNHENIKRNHDDDTDNLFIYIKKRQKQNGDHMKIADDILHISLAYEDLISGNIINFTKLLKEILLTRSQRSLSSANESVLQVIVELLLPSRYRVPELCLIMNTAVNKGNGKFGFLDVFILGESYANLELKYIPLIWLISNINGKQAKDFNANELEELDKILEREDEDTLLKRQYRYYDKETNKYIYTTINDVLNDGTKQLERYTKIIAKGKANKYSAGVYDERIKIINSNPNKLIGFIIVVIGFRRIIWRSIDEKSTNYRYIKIK
ncbi:unnamed protein product [Rhizophagus irregularis]|uniref:Uncharacterized protein n=2 Tax=Rhizophagus irregularis TaxID=588596 RepID=A0A915ZA85_9GLOM|nr:unnamed protein product [Rhizophagus irregularis]